MYVHVKGGGGAYVPSHNWSGLLQEHGPKERAAGYKDCKKAAVNNDFVAGEHRRQFASEACLWLQKPNDIGAFRGTYT